MYKNNIVAVVIPAYNEEKLIGRVIETMPNFVDKMVIIDDCSSDKTSEAVQKHIESSTGENRIELIRHAENQGVGGAIATGYKWCRDNNMDVAVVMAGDAQMDPVDLPNLLEPIINNEADYTKGNRLFSGDAWTEIPRVRYLGNSALSLLTKIASGYWDIADSQSGYAAINKKALKRINWDEMYKRYGQPNDILVRLNIYNFRVCDVVMNPVYGVGEKSGIKPFRMIPKLSLLLFRLFLYRMFQKYIVRDTHPLVLFYVFGFFLHVVSIPMFFRFFSFWSIQGAIPEITFLSLLFSITFGVQLILFAMLFDMEANKNLRVKKG